MKRTLLRALLRAGLAVVVAAVVLSIEGARVVAVAGVEVAGTWEHYLLLRGVPAVTLLAALPAIAVVVAYGALLPIVQRPRGRAAWAIAAAMIAAAFAIELSIGPRAREPLVRVPFVLGLAGVAACTTALVGPPLVSVTRRLPLVAGLLGAGTIAGALVADARVLPRLYPAFHLGLLGLAVIGVVAVAHALLEALVTRARRWVPVVPVVVASLLAYSVVRGRRAVSELANFENARRIADERSRLLARGVALAAILRPPRPLEEAPPDADQRPERGPRILDAAGRDLLLVTIDALRADHVGAYGYHRPTTPALDRLAAEGVLFERAYTPTPHTSYAIASLMTGKYLRPVLALEAAAGGGRRPDETWAGLLRTYGFRTAAFYPPAVWAVDHERFAALAGRGLDFEYEKKEFAAPDLRVLQVREYLARVPRDVPLFVWVHLFEPHEPYVAHQAHAFGESEIDRYDSEIAAADAGLGEIVRTFRQARPGSIVVVSADHGEAFGEHGARYHGTTVYEEQVRVPLVVSAPGLVASDRRVSRPVQLVDLVPTFLSAYAIPIPPRVRGNDLGPVLAPEPRDSGDPRGFAFAEVEDAAMIARGDARLICARRTASCALYDLSSDPLQLAARPNDPRIEPMRRELAATFGTSARVEGFAGTDVGSWPEPLRRAFAGDAEAAIEVAPLLDDVDVAFRRRAAEALARLARPETEEQIRRALPRESDPDARQWLVVARARTALTTRLHSVDLAALVALLEARPDLSRYAALAIGENLARGGGSPGPGFQARAWDALVDWLPTARTDGELGRTIIDLLPVLIRGSVGATARRATPILIEALADIRLRVSAARTLGYLGDPTAQAALDAQLRIERHVDARIPEVVALARVGGGEAALAHLARFLGVPEVPPGAGDAFVEVARYIAPKPWFVAWTGKDPTSARVGVIVPKGAAHRLIVVGPPIGAEVHGTVGGVPFATTATEAGVVVELEGRVARSIGEGVAMEITTSKGAISHVAVVARVDDLPPPKPDRGVEREGGDAP
jgi:arylsulfatase A-like enzyme